jgi:hypothetical protein
LLLLGAAAAAPAPETRFAAGLGAGEAARFLAGVGGGAGDEAREAVRFLAAEAAGDEAREPARFFAGAAALVLPEAAVRAVLLLASGSLSASARPRFVPRAAGAAAGAAAAPLAAGVVFLGGMAWMRCGDADGREAGGASAARRMLMARRGRQRSFAAGRRAAETAAALHGRCSRLASSASLRRPMTPTLLSTSS